MKKVTIFGLLVILISMSSCELIGDIFKAGVWVGVLAVIGVVGLVFFLIAKVFGGK